MLCFFFLKLEFVISLMFLGQQLNVMQISSWNTFPSSCTVELAGPTVCSEDDTGVTAGAAGLLLSIPLVTGVFLGNSKELWEMLELFSRGYNIVCCKFRGVNKIRFPIAVSQAKLWKEGGGDKVSFLQHLGLWRNVKLHSFLPSHSWKLTQEIDRTGRQFSDRNPRTFNPRSWDGDKKLGTHQRVTQEFCWLS